MQTEDKYLIVSILFAVVVGSIFYSSRLPSHSAHDNSSMEQGHVQQSLPLTVTRAMLMGKTYQNEGLQHPYMIVEFGDYQCPPCAALHSRLKEFVAAHNTLVGLAFRHFPLQQIHPAAFNIALYAEAARDQGKFWEMHDLLYANEAGTTVSDLEKYAQQLHLEMGILRHSLKTTAQTRVKSDLDVALNLNLEYTPTLILCEPGEKARIIGFEELEKSIP